MAATITTPSAASLLNSGLALLSTVTGFDLNIITDQNMFQVLSPFSCIPVFFVLRNASISLTTMSIGFGFNAATSNDVVATATHTILTAATLYDIAYAKAGAKVGVGANGDWLRGRCSIAQGAAATCTIDTFGYLV